MSTFVADSMCH